VKQAAGPQKDENQRGSEAQRRAPEPRYLVVGQVVGTHGLRGELKVKPLTDDPDRFGQLERVLVGVDDEEPVPWVLQTYRIHKNHALLQLAGCDDQTTAQTFKGMLIQIPREEALPLEEDEYFEHQILGLSVWTADGDHLGVVEEIIYTAAHEVYAIQEPGSARREILIPAIESVVLDVDLDAGRLTVDLPEGLT
jgi:16S rRNA processing protein RimM